MSSRSESSMAEKKVLQQRTGIEADRVGQPPFLGRELDDVLLAFRVDDKTTQATVHDESRVACHLAAALEEFARGQPTGDEHGLHESEVLR